MGADGGQRPVEDADRRGHQRLLRKVAGIGHEIAGGEIVGTIGDEIVAGNDIERVVRREPHPMGLDVHMGIEAAERRGGALHLGPADIAGGVDDLALQVRQRDRIVVDHAERADAGRREIKQHRRAESAGADDQHPRPLERRLAGAADLAQDEVAGIALDLIGIEHGTVGRIHGKARFILRLRDAGAVSFRPRS